MSKQKRAIRCYPITTYQNDKKNSSIVNLLKEYRKFSGAQIKKQYSIFTRIGYFQKFVPTNQDESLLSERFKRCAVYQAVAQLTAWQSNRENKIKAIIKSSNVSNEMKRKLYLIISFGVRHPQTLLIKGKKKQVEPIEIAREAISIFKSINRQVRWKLPNHRRIGLQLNSNVCKLIKKRNTKKCTATSFDYWINLSTLERGNVLKIPAKMNDYLETKLKEGKSCNAIRIDDKDGNFIFNLMIEKEPVKPIEVIKEIAVDFGTKHLFALSTGDIFGKNFGIQLKKYDTEIQKLQKALQQQKIKPNNSKRYRRFQRKCHSFIENEINRNLNKIVLKSGASKIILEDLDFSNSKLSKSMNRILRRCGRSVIKSKLDMLKEDYGVIVEEVNPAYTSQRCNRCGFVHRKNRKNRDTFECLFCHFKKHADYQAATNIEERSSLPFEFAWNKRTIKKHLFNNFKEDILRCGKSSTAKPLFWRFLCPDRRAFFLDFDFSNLSSFEDFFEILKSGNKQKMVGF